MECMRTQFKDGTILDGRFETISALNHGSFGMVFMARDLHTDDMVAVKCLTKTSDATISAATYAVDEYSEELAIHRSLNAHPNIVNLIHTFESPNHIYLVLELCPNGDLYEAIRLGRGPLETEHVRDFVHQLISAIEFMHGKGIYHRDIKPENIFLTQDGSMKLGDFGLATTDKWSFESAVGSDRYMAPEQYDCGTTGYSPAKADIWAVGICLLNVLFSRNPFATPTVSDPLFRDFVSDRQSLFDVFPNMSQDTFEILVHCLAIDPANRSLEAAKEALDRVITFTTDDETLDDFCVEDREVVGVTANREPLRTPSVSTAQPTLDGSFPWAKALAMTPPPQPVRKLSAIPDDDDDDDDISEDLFPASERRSQDWCSLKPESASIVSFVDSGLGISLQSSLNVSKPRPIHNPASRPMAIPGSMPARPMPNMASVLGLKQDMVSKSWSDLWDEEEEEIENAFQQKLGFAERVFSHETGSGRTTPRAGLREVKDPAAIHNSRNRSPPAAPRVINEQTGFVFEDLHHEDDEEPKEQQKPAPKRIVKTTVEQTSTPKYSPPKKRTGFDMAKRWAALGDKRRAPQSPSSVKTATPASVGGTKRALALDWKRGLAVGEHPPLHGSSEHLGVFGKGQISSSGGGAGGVHQQQQPHHKGQQQQHQDWSLSKDWRRNATHHHVVGAQSCGRSVVADDIGDLEWVGGWHDLHL